MIGSVYLQIINRVIFLISDLEIALNIRIKNISYSLYFLMFLCVKVFKILKLKILISDFNDVSDIGSYMLKETLHIISCSLIMYQGLLMKLTVVCICTQTVSVSTVGLSSL